MFILLTYNIVYVYSKHLMRESFCSLLGVYKGLSVHIYACVKVFFPLIHTTSQGQLEVNSTLLLQQFSLSRILLYTVQWYIIVIIGTYIVTTFANGLYTLVDNLMHL